MNPTELLKTIYLGDRACKAIEIDGWNAQVSVHVDVISRIRSTSGIWDYFTDEDIVDGRLVFTGVKSLRMEPSGPLPNDLINELSVVGSIETASGTEYSFLFSVSSVDEAARSTEIVIELRAKGLHLQDPLRPGAVIV